MSITSRSQNIWRSLWLDLETEYLFLPRRSVTAVAPSRVVATTRVVSLLQQGRIARRSRFTRFHEVTGLSDDGDAPSGRRDLSFG